MPKHDPESEWARRNGPSIDVALDSPMGTMARNERDSRELGWLQAVWWVHDSLGKEDMSAETLRSHLKCESEAIGRGV